MSSDRLSGLAAIAVALAFSACFAALGAMFDYPDILRQAPGLVLERFHKEGTALVLVWWGFMASALSLLPVGFALAAATAGNRSPRLLAMTGTFAAAAALSQAIGLSRWVFVIPGLSALHAASPGSPDAVFAEQAFALLNAYGGVAIGEHLGQWLTVGFLAGLTALQMRRNTSGFRLMALFGSISALLIAAGTGESLLIGLGRPDPGFGLSGAIGYSLLAPYLILSGLLVMRSDHRTIPNLLADQECAA